MARVRNMQGTPAHIETLRKTDERRHPAHCVFASGIGKSRTCMCTQSGFYKQHCSSAKICAFYESKLKEN